MKFPMINFFEFLCRGGFQVNNRRFLLFILCVLSFIWANMCIYRYYQSINKNSLVMLNLMLIMFLVIFFFSSESFNLYVMFELSVLPIFIIIVGWGYQTERLEARLSLLLSFCRNFFTFCGHESGGHKKSTVYFSHRELKVTRHQVVV